MLAHPLQRPSSPEYTSASAPAQPFGARRYHAPRMQRSLIKQRAKQVVRRTLGEPYVGKRLKLRRLNHVMRDLDIQPHDILDAGAEDATFVYWLADRYPSARVSAVDIDHGAIDACLRTRPSAYADRVDFRVGDFESLEPESFDLVTAFDVLEHITDDGGAVRALHRSLRPGGTLLVHVPRERWLTRDGRIHRFPDQEAWRINTGHVRQGYSLAAMSSLLTGCGFEVREVQAWLGRWGTLAHEFYERVERPAPLRVLSIPVTDVCAWLDRRADTTDGNTVYAHAVKPAA